MTKLEEKLIELGYEKNLYINNYYTKKSRAVSNVVIFISIFHNEIDDKGITLESNIRKEREIDLLYASFKEMQRDLKILEGVEND